jgi:hypothetical protein
MALLFVHVMTAMLRMGGVGLVVGICALSMELMLRHGARHTAHAHTAVFVL